MDKGKKSVGRGKFFAQIVEEKGEKIKVRKKTYYYKTQHHKETTFSYDVHDFQRRHKLSLNEICDYFGVSFWALQNWMKKGGKPVFIDNHIEMMRKLDALRRTFPGDSGVSAEIEKEYTNK